jgi:hypothetical protein
MKGMNKNYLSRGQRVDTISPPLVCIGNMTVRINNSYTWILIIFVACLFIIGYRVYNSPNAVCNSLSDWAAQDENTKYINEWADLLFKNENLWNEISNGQPYGGGTGSVKLGLDLEKLKMHGAIFGGINVLWTDTKLERNKGNVAALALRFGREGLIIHMGDYPPETPGLFALFENSIKASHKNVSVYCTSSTING